MCCLYNFVAFYSGWDVWHVWVLLNEPLFVEFIVHRDGRWWITYYGTRLYCLFSHVQLNLSKLNPFGTDTLVQYRHIFGLHRFKLHRYLVKSVWYRQIFSGLRVQFRQGSLYYSTVIFFFLVSAPSFNYILFVLHYIVKYTFLAQIWAFAIT